MVAERGRCCRDVCSRVDGAKHLLLQRMKPIFVSGYNCIMCVRELQQNTNARRKNVPLRGAGKTRCQNEAKSEYENEAHPLDGGFGNDFGLHFVVLYRIYNVCKSCPFLSTISLFKTQSDKEFLLYFRNSELTFSGHC